MNKKILIADDEKEIIELLQLYLENEGYEIVAAYDGLSALEIIEKQDVGLAVVDIMMPKLDGFQLVKKIRSKFNIPVIILSAKNQDVDKILGLGLGADDYVTKPFNPLEVLARIQAQLRRFYKLNTTVEPDKTEEICIGDLTLDVKGCLAYKNRQQIQLTHTEYKLLRLFMEHPNRVFTKKQIFENVWEENYYDDENTIMVYISKLREKIEDDSKHPTYLKTVRGLGYMFEKKVANS